MGLNVGNVPVKQVFVGSTPVKAVYVGSVKIWPTRETVQITLGTGMEAHDQLRAALTDRGLDYQTVTEIPFDIELVGTGSTHNMFRDCFALTHAPAMDTSSVTDMGLMFNGCSSLVHAPDLATGQVTDMSYMFNGCAALTSAPAMDTSNATTMRTMFQHCSSLTHVPDMNTAQVTDISYMFYGCSALTDGNVRLIGRHPSVATDNMISSSGLSREPFYTTDGQPWPTSEVHEVSLTDVRGSYTLHPLLTVTVPAGETWDVRIQGTVTKASVSLPQVRIGDTTFGPYAQGAAVDCSGTVTSVNTTIAIFTRAATSSNSVSFTGTVTIEK